MILIKYNNRDGFIPVKFRRVSDNIVCVVGSNIRNTSGFSTYLSSGVKLGDFTSYTDIYREVSEEEVWYSNDGSVYKAPEIFVPRKPTEAEIKQMLIDGVQDHMDKVVMTRGYDGILSACSYIDTGIERFDKEGEAARVWRSKVWDFCYSYLDEVLAGTKNIPSLEELIKELPKIDW